MMDIDDFLVRVIAENSKISKLYRKIEEIEKLRNQTMEDVGIS